MMAEIRDGLRAHISKNHTQLQPVRACAEKKRGSPVVKIHADLFLWDLRTEIIVTYKTRSAG